MFVSVDGEQKEGTLNTPGCPYDGLPSSTQHVRDEQFLTGESTATTGVAEKKTVQRNGRYRLVSQPTALLGQEDSSATTGPTVSSGRPQFSRPPSSIRKKRSSSIINVIMS